MAALMTDVFTIHEHMHVPQLLSYRRGLLHLVAGQMLNV